MNNYNRLRLFCYKRLISRTLNVITTLMATAKWRDLYTVVNVHCTDLATLYMIMIMVTSYPDPNTNQNTNPNPNGTPNALRSGQDRTICNIFLTGIQDCYVPYLQVVCDHTTTRVRVRVIMCPALLLLWVHEGCQTIDIVPAQTKMFRIGRFLACYSPCYGFVSVIGQG